MTAAQPYQRVRHGADAARGAVLDWWRRIPLRTRLTSLATLAVAIAVLTVSSAVFLFTDAQLRGQFDDKLIDEAKSLVQSFDPSPSSRLLERGDSPWDRQRDIPLWQYVRTDHTVEQPNSQPKLALPISAADVAVVTGASGPVYEDVNVGGHHYRMVTMPVRDGAIQFARQPVDIDESLTKLALLLLMVSAAGVAAAGLLGWSVARAGLAPVDRLTAAAEHVAATQDLTAAIAVSGEDELARLGTAFNAMLAALGTSRDAQRRLVEDASHELRTPLTSLRTNIELLIRAEDTGRTLPPADRARLLHDLNGQVVELTQLISELVELARNDASEEPDEALDLADIVMAAVERARVRGPGVKIHAELHSAPIVGRAASLERAVLNILDNATKWTPAGEPISVRLSRAWVAGRDSAVLEVEDRGPGVADEDRDRIFERFYRAMSARSMPGSGLGLAIVAQAVAGHGGAVGVERAPAGGALFRIVLPIAVEPPTVFTGTGTGTGPTAAATAATSDIAPAGDEIWRPPAPHLPPAPAVEPEQQEFSPKS